jgi:hypothetical protein
MPESKDYTVWWAVKREPLYLDDTVIKEVRVVKENPATLTFVDGKKYRKDDKYWVYKRTKAEAYEYLRAYWHFKIDGCLNSVISYKSHIAEVYEMEREDSESGAGTLDELAYSLSGEEYYRKIEDVLEEFTLDYLGDEPLDGMILEIHEGTLVPYTAGDFVGYASHMIDDMRESAYDIAMEWSDSWLDSVSSAQENGLDRVVKLVVDAWADKHDLQPKFFTVDRTRKIKIRLIEEGTNYELVGDVNV